jgi:hypothetical protein
MASSRMGVGLAKGAGTVDGSVLGSERWSGDAAMAVGVLSIPWLARKHIM